MSVLTVENRTSLKRRLTVRLNIRRPSRFAAERNIQMNGLVPEVPSNITPRAGEIRQRLSPGTRIRALPKPEVPRCVAPGGLPHADPLRPPLERHRPAATAVELPPERRRLPGHAAAPGPGRDAAHVARAARDAAATARVQRHGVSRGAEVRRRRRKVVLDDTRTLDRPALGSVLLPTAAVLSTRSSQPMWWTWLSG